MKIAVSSVGPTLASQVDPRFGRCAYFIIADIESGQHEAVDNSNTFAERGWYCYSTINRQQKSTGRSYWQLRPECLLGAFRSRHHSDNRCFRSDNGCYSEL